MECDARCQGARERDYQASLARRGDAKFSTGHGPLHPAGPHAAVARLAAHSSYPCAHGVVRAILGVAMMGPDFRQFFEI